MRERKTVPASAVSYETALTDAPQDFRHQSPPKSASPVA